MYPMMKHAANKSRMRIAAAALVAATAVGIVGAASADAVPFTIGANFTGTDLSAINAAHFPWVVPPDTMGAVGPDHVAELINTSFAVYDKTGALQSRVRLPDFWENAFANAGTAAQGLVRQSRFPVP